MSLEERVREAVSDLGYFKGMVSQPRWLHPEGRPTNPSLFVAVGVVDAGKRYRLAKSYSKAIR